MESNHPVLTELKERIANLETENAQLHKDYENLLNASRAERQRYIDLKESIRAELLEVASQYPNDKDIIADIANRLDADLTETKTYEINVTFNVEIEVPFGEDSEPNFDWDFDFSIDSSVHDIQGHTSDVIYGQEA